MAGVSTDDSDGLTLNVMPMLDIFSILMTFLLMSYSTDPVQYDVNAGVELPESTTMSALDEVPTVIVTKDEILVNDKKIASIFGGDVPEKDRNQGAVYAVYEELDKLAKANKRLQNLTAQELKSKTSTLTMEMDEGHRFQLMKRIMLSAQQAEFVTFKLMVAREG